MSDNKYEEQIENIIFVSCLLCERAMKMPFLNIKDAYPATVMVNQWMMGKSGRPQAISVPMNAYLCKEHYKEEINRVKLEMPEWCRGIEDVQEGRADALICVIRAFAPEESELLYFALQYAHEKNVPVHFAPRNSADKMYMLTNETQDKLEKERPAKAEKIRRAN